ncbi:MAG: ATPase P [Deltaproteobacteria bacterium]|nr:ATPase P [Deltaproteobacteria bacterium]
MRMDIPGAGNLVLDYLVLDFTGTLSISGYLIPGVAERLKDLSNQLKINVLTADTFGKVRQALDGLPVKLTIMDRAPEDRFKEAFVESLGADRVAAMGNGNNDRLMLKKAALGVAVIEGEGCSVQTLVNADLVVNSILDGLDLLREPLRIRAGLRF